MEHIKSLDVNNTGIKRDVAIIMEAKDGSIFYVDIASLGPIDKGRLKAALTSPGSKSMPLWQVLSTMTLNNGLNALDYFHTNFVKKIGGKGKKGQAGLEAVKANGVGKMIGSEYTDPSSATQDPTKAGSIAQ